MKALRLPSSAGRAETAQQLRSGVVRADEHLAGSAAAVSDERHSVQPADVLATARAVGDTLDLSRPAGRPPPADGAGWRLGCSCQSPHRSCLRRLPLVAVRHGTAAVSCRATPAPTRPCPRAMHETSGPAEGCAAEPRPSRSWAGRHVPPSQRSAFRIAETGASSSCAKRSVYRALWQRDWALSQRVMLDVTLLQSRVQRRRQFAVGKRRVL